MKWSQFSTDHTLPMLLVHVNKFPLHYKSNSQKNTFTIKPLWCSTQNVLHNYQIKCQFKKVLMPSFFSLHFTFVAFFLFLLSFFVTVMWWTFFLLWAAGLMFISGLWQWCFPISWPWPWSFSVLRDRPALAVLVFVVFSFSTLTFFFSF